MVDKLPENILTRLNRFSHSIIVVYATDRVTSSTSLQQFSHAFTKSVVQLNIERS